ncbi:T9SS type A sorting domain-containing protein [Bacteroidales bacterium OttesenSCG-928-B11]|nr:T9SS type A sorting domain-containing protein [Bacteroidales bacterium OttesenSCG-928-C03]MDL2311826.1 T9SS type A sorting domain-containing protein [Bacteroidales bacterium OttesenSCG-928-B11]MDL2325525.1 T9SS type A sorting domain-containing protein [Bacteroidales bacterium OttesenSCG-928-A14]
MIFNKKLSFLLITLTILILTPDFLYGQERLTGLRQNTSLQKLSKAGSTHEKKRSEPAIKLPFFEDFSNYTGYPNPELWMDRAAFVSSTFALYPPTIGVATLDALNWKGEVYAHASSSSFPADTLTSRPIRLDSNFLINRVMTIADSVYFSFFYQPGGGYTSNPWEVVGNKPETNDKLILEFGFATGEIVFAGYDSTDYIVTGTYYVGDSIPNIYIPGTWYVFTEVCYPGQVISMPSDSIFVDEMLWDQVWTSNGLSLNSWLSEDPRCFFKQVIIPIEDEIYLRDNFQFRFRNYASLDDDDIPGWASNVDQWHIDYVRLDCRRTREEYVYPVDVAFVEPTTSFLEKYQAMPWNQFRPSDMKTHFNNTLSNLSANNQNTNYTYFIHKKGVEYAPQYPTSSENAPPYSTSGFHTYSKHANPEITFTISYDGADSATFRLLHVFQIEGTTSDVRNQNDTAVYDQKFHNYYAYDDGTPEAGYSIMSTMQNPSTYFAMRFDLAQPDTLRSIRLFFNGVHEDGNVERFTLKVWKAMIVGGDTIPGNELYSKESLFPRHGNDYLDFVDYLLDEPILVSGMIFVGYHQTHNVQLNLGFDQNTDARGYYMYKIANDWKQSFLKGSPMVRIVLGKYFDPLQTTVKKDIAKNINIYPNPTTTTAKIEISDPAIQVNQIMVYDVYGKLLDVQQVNSSAIIVEMNRFSPGIYVLRLMNDRKAVHAVKIVKQ